MKKSELKYKSWMVTILTDKANTIDLPAKDDVVRVFNEEAEKWLFQEEEHSNSDIPKTHYQCCLVTKIRKRKKTLLKNLADGLGHPLEFIRVEKMAGSWEQAMLYCSKGEGRVGETLKSSTIMVDYDFADVKFLDDPEKRYPWQNKILYKLFEAVPHNIKDSDDRSIIWITDEQGNNGKSKLLKYICAHNDLCIKLSFGTANQLRAAVVSAGPRRLYVLDVPRTLGDDDSMNDILSTVEDIKNGYVVSSFYGNYQKLVMNPPAVLIMSNMRCPIKKMSADRWQCYIIKDRDLKYSLDNPDYVEKGYSMTNEGEIISRIHEIGDQL